MALLSKIISNETLEFLNINNIQSGFKKVGYSVGQKLHFLDNISVEPYVGFHGSFNLCPIGFQSYTSSSVPTNISIGRYSSLAWGIDFPSFNHPILSISSSPFTHDLSKDEVHRVLRDFPKETKLNNVVPNPQKMGVVIENDCWIGQNAVLMAGIKIGTGAIIASHSVVTKSVEPYSIVGGNPASLIRWRFPLEIREALLSLKWWEYNFVDFNHLDIGDIGKFIQQFDALKSQLPIYSPTRIKLNEMP